MRASTTIALLTAATAIAATSCGDGGDDADADADDVIETLDQLEGATELIDPNDLAGDDAVRLTLPEPGTLPPPDTQAPRPLTADELDIEIDDTGRPYEVQRGWYDRAEHTTESLGLMSVPDGELRIIDGIAASVDLGFFADEATAVSLGSRYDRLAITVHQLVTTLGAEDRDGDDDAEADAGDDAEADDLQATVTQIVAVRLDVIGGGSVERWEPFEFAYGTDGGSGGVTSDAVLGAAAESTGDVLDDLDPNRRLDNLLGGELPDLLVFSNGVGDGAFPMSRGLDRNGDVVSIVLPSLTYPWRLMIADGEPPADVTTRETEYLECLRGTRPLTVDGECLNDPS